MYTPGVAVPTSHQWPLGDGGKQAKSHRGVSGPPPYPRVIGYPLVSVTIDLPIKCSPNFRANGVDWENGVQKKVGARTLIPDLRGKR